MRIVGTIAVSAAVILGIAAATAAAVAHTHSDVPPGGAHGVGTDMNMSMAMAPATADLPALQLAHARIATAKYAGDLNAAKKAGYEILTQQIAGMGYHFINPPSRASTSASPRSSSTSDTVPAGSSARSSGSSRRSPRHLR